MPTNVIEHIRRTVLLRDCADLCDGELLGRFIERHDEGALAALVKRHGPMVWGVCRRQLSHHDAEDAFQAAFIVLVRKASTIVPREMVGNWLYGVAHQTALQARRTAARRRVQEVQVTEMPDTADVRQDRWTDLQPVLDQELSRLPDHYRVVIVLSDLEGKSRKEVAAQLGCPEGTVASRLVRARSMLARRLTRRGVALSGGALAVALSRHAASAVMPASVVVSTIKAANLIAAEHAAIPVRVAALAEGVLKTMLLTKLKSVMAMLVVAAVVGLIGFGVVMGQQKGDAPQKQASEKTAEDAVVKEKADEAIAWGKEVGGLQASLGYHPGQKRAYRHGETVRLVVRVRNVSKNKVKFSYLVEFLEESAPAVTDAKGTAVPFEGKTIPGGIQGLREVDLAPGKEIELYELKMNLRPASEQAEKLIRTVYGTGSFHIQYKQLDTVRSSTEELYPGESLLSKLATGKLELEVKDEPAEKK